MAGRQAARAARRADPGKPPDPVGRPRPPMHLHWFRRLGDDPYSGAVLYVCRCGAVRPGF
jgi:hypothetical protein